MARRKTFHVNVSFEAYHDGRSVCALPPPTRVTVRCVKWDTALQTALGHGRSKLARVRAAAFHSFEAAHPSGEGWTRHSQEARVASITEGGSTTIF